MARCVICGDGCGPSVITFDGYCPRCDAQRSAQKRPFAQKSAKLASAYEASIRQKIAGQKLKDAIYVGMPYEEIVRLVGEPARKLEGTATLRKSGQGANIFLSEESERNWKRMLDRTLYCAWTQPEGEYELTFENGRLSKIHSTP